MAKLSGQEVLQSFKPSRTIWPILIGVAVAAYILFRDFDISVFQGINWNLGMGGLMIVAIIMMICRDLAYIIRMRLLADKQLNWRSAFQVTLLWEFSNAVTPSVSGGTPIMIFLLFKEGLSLGKSTAIIFLTILIDQLYFILIVPVVLLLVGPEEMFRPLSAIEANTLFGQGVYVTFWIVYSILFCYISFLLIALIVKPIYINRLIKRVFMLKWLKRWRRGGFTMANELLNAADNFRNKPFHYWLKIGGLTLWAWFSRYMVLNSILAAFAVASLGLYDHMIIYSRQVVMFFMMIISPTPGSSGIAELMFQTLFADLTLEGLTSALAVLWRSIGYYPYLFIGAILLPHWIKRVYGSMESAQADDGIQT